MKTKSLYNLIARLILVIVVLSFMADCGDAHAQGSIPKTKTTNPTPPPAERPKRMKGVAPETVTLPFNFDPYQEKTYDVYLDRFAVWTEDTVSVIMTVGDRGFIKKIEKSPYSG